MKKRKKFLTKISLFFAMALLCIISFVVPTKAYYVDNNGNLASDNLFNESATTFHAITYDGSFSYYRAFTGFYTFLESGTYTLSSNAFNDGFSISVLGTSYETLTTAANNIILDTNYQTSPLTFTISQNLYCGFYFKKVLNNADQVFTASDLSQYYYMLNIGSIALNYEPYAIYYSQTNYDSYGSAQYSLGYDDALAITNNSVSILDKSNLYSCGLYYHIMRNQQVTKYHLNFVYNGVYGYEEAQNWNELDVNNWNVANEQWQTNMENNVYTPYGFFYKTNWSIWQFIQEYSDATAITEDETSYLEYNFITPIDLDNLYFGNVGFSYFEFYDNEGNLLFRQSETLGYFPVTVSGCKIIRAYSIHSDYADEPVYFYTSSKSGYNSGYFDGYVSRQTEIENLKNQINEINETNLSLRNQISYLENQLNNLNGSWQSVFFSLVDIPFLTVSKCLGFDLFGLNLYRALIGILTIMAIFFLFRKIMGK